MNITDEMLEAGKRAYASCGSGISLDAEIEAILEAAAPLIAAQALREAADHVDRGPTFPLPPSVISALLREKADDYAPDAP